MEIKLGNVQDQRENLGENTGGRESSAIIEPYQIGRAINDRQKKNSDTLCRYESSGYEVELKIRRGKKKRKENIDASFRRSVVRELVCVQFSARR